MSMLCNVQELFVCVWYKHSTCFQTLPTNCVFCVNPQTAWLAAGLHCCSQTWAAVVVVEPIPCYLFICQCERVCVWGRKCTCTYIFMRTNLSFRWVRTFWPVLTLGRTFNGLSEGSDLVLGFMLELGLVRVGIRHLEVMVKVRVRG